MVARRCKILFHHKVFTFTNYRTRTEPRRSLDPPYGSCAGELANILILSINASVFTSSDRISANCDALIASLTLHTPLLVDGNTSDFLPFRFFTTSPAVP